MWKVGDVCFVAGEGDEIFVISEVSAGQVALFGHGREPLEKLQRLTPSMLELARDDLTPAGNLQAEALRSAALALARPMSPVKIVETHTSRTA